MNKVIFVLVAILSSANLLAQKKSLTIDGIKRSYIEYIPKSYTTSNDRYPVVLNFHGGGMTAAEQMLYTEMNRCAEENNFIVVYPVGVQKDWNVGFDMSYKKGVDDVSFIKALVVKLKDEYRLDTTAIFATGLSRGGFFCHRLAAESPEIFAAVASVGGPLPDSVKYFHSNKHPVSVMLVQGTEDEVVKYDGKDEGYSSAKQTFEYWRQHNRLATALNTYKVDKVDDATSVDVHEVTNRNTSVLLLTINGGGHTWPGSDSFNIGYPLGKTSQDINLNQLMWEFFKRSRRR